MAALALAGCGGEAPPNVSPQVARWAGASLSVQSLAVTCVRQPRPGAVVVQRSCLKPALDEYAPAAHDLGEALRHVDNRLPACGFETATVAADVGQVTDLQERMVGGRPGDIASATKRIRADVGRAREAAGAIGRGCPK